jgi:hypothetical protein
MDISLEEFSSLSQKMEDRRVRISELEREVQREREGRLMAEEKYMTLLRENERLKMERNDAEFRASYLREYIILSAEKISEFVKRLKNIDRWAFLRSFVMWVLPEELRSEEMRRIEEVMALPVEESAGITNNFNGPVGQVVGHAEIVDEKTE